MAKAEPVTSTGARPTKLKNDSAGRVMTTKGGSNVAYGNLSPRNSAPIINKC